MNDEDYLNALSSQWLSHSYYPVSSRQMALYTPPFLLKDTTTPIPPADLPPAVRTEDLAYLGLSSAFVALQPFSQTSFEVFCHFLVF